MSTCRGPLGLSVWLVLCAVLAAPGLTQAQSQLPRHVDLWLSPPPADGALESCAEAVPREWALVQAGALLQAIDQGTSTLLILPRLNGEASATSATQRCFQWRQGEHVLAQGTVVAKESSRRIAKPMLVMVLDHRSKTAPHLELFCGFPSPAPHAIRYCQHGWRITPFLQPPWAPG